MWVMPIIRPVRLNISFSGAPMTPSCMRKLLTSPRLDRSAIQPKERTTRLSISGKMTSSVSGRRSRAGPRTMR